jgi:quercetin dioxygenase-like cupin family protein
VNRDQNDPLILDPDAEAADTLVMERIALALQPIELGERQRSDLRRRVLYQAREQTPAGTTTVRADAVAWFRLSPTVEVKMLRCDALAGNQTILMRVAAGGMIPRHQHSQEEEFIVLQGECHIGTHRLAAGDVHIAAAGSWHEEITTQNGTLVLVRGEYPPPLAVRAMFRAGAN